MARPKGVNKATIQRCISKLSTYWSDEQLNQLFLGISLQCPGYGNDPVEDLPLAGCLPTERQHHAATTTVFCAVSELATAGQGAIGALMATDVPAQADFGLDVLPQALGPLLTRPKLWHLLGASLCALVCAKTWKQATTSDHICAQGYWQLDQR